MALLGTFCITISFILSIYSILGFLISMKFKAEELKISARWSSYLTLPIISIAVYILVYSFVTHDFSIKYVFNHSNISMEPIYTWVAIYAGNEGSLLYISTVISLGSFLTIKTLQKRIPESVPHITIIMMGILSFFLGVMLFLADPFTLLESQVQDGRGINPEKIHVIFPGINKPKVVENIFKIKAEEIFGESFPKIITVARLDKRKGHDKILMLIKSKKGLTYRKCYIVQEFLYHKLDFP